MALEFSDIKPGQRLSSVVAGSDVTVVSVEHHGETSATLVYRDGAGRLGEQIITAADLEGIPLASDRRWSFDADGADFRLASEARRMQNAHLADPYAAVDTSNIEPYPHQIDAVYNRLLARKPLKFVLADDPGAGKTIMSGLLIRELMLRGDVARCLVVAPGSLVEQWQDEMGDRFGLRFEMMSRAAVEASLTSNPFQEKNLLIARIDQLARGEDLIAKLKVTDWDLVIVDEAHKMSAHRYGDELRKTKRFELGETLRDQTRHLLLLTATPHNGRNEDFYAFMTLIDPERFAGRLRDGGEMPDVSDVMRRKVKENLLTFEGKRIFPQRQAETLNFELSGLELDLYEAVTEYVRNGMNRADRMAEEGSKRRGIIVGFALAGLQRRLASSPEAIYRSLERRQERLEEQFHELQRPASEGRIEAVAKLEAERRIQDPAELDYDDFEDEDLEQLEDQAIDDATVARTAAELETEITELKRLVWLADRVRRHDKDAKWVELRDLLRSDDFTPGDNPRKLIVFSEHKDTVDYLTRRIGAELGRPEAVVTIHGGLRRESRREIQQRFRVNPEVEVLVATDAAGEGVNLQAANLMVNYDLPWNPNRIEQRFGRIHRIGQMRPCHLWNLVAHQTREGQVFERLFAKIEQQRQVYGDQVYDVLGESHLNASLRGLLIRAIRDESSDEQLSFLDEVIDADIGRQFEAVLRERALVAGLGDPAADNDEIRDLMERARARKLQPWFVEAFFTEVLRRYGGRIASREPGRFEVTRVSAAVRACADPRLGPVHDRYERVTFDKDHVKPPPGAHGGRAMLVSPGTALLTAAVDKVMSDCGRTLSRGAVLVDPADPGPEPRLLVYLEHSVTDGRRVNGQPQVVSRRFQYVEIDRLGQVRDAGDEPYIGYAPPTEEQRELLDGRLDLDWADRTAEQAARDWAIEHLAGPHFDAIRAVTAQRVARVQEAVRERLTSEIRYWDQRAAELRAAEQQAAGRKFRLNSDQAQQRAEDLATRLARRRLELDTEAKLQNSPPTVVSAAVVIPQGWFDRLEGSQPDPGDADRRSETNRRAVAAAMAAERTLGRQPEEQAHSNPGYDILSMDPATGARYFIEVKGHRPGTAEISVSAQQVQKAKSSPDRWRLAVVTVPDDPGAEPTVRYLIEPFADVRLHFAQTGVVLDVADLLEASVVPR